MATYDGNTLTGAEKFKKGDIIDFKASGAAKSVVLAPGKYKLECWGAQGGTYNDFNGGRGGYSKGVIAFEQETTVFAVAGKRPPANTTTGSSNVSEGGFNGGGTSKVYSYSGTTSYGQGGGGGSDIRIGVNDLYARVIVAGGGAGSCSVDVSATGYGGGLTGGSAGGTSYTGKETAAGSGGAFGKGGNATGSYNYKYGAGGGGGGWYGGGASTAVSDSSSSNRTMCGGGSGYVYTSSTASKYPSGCKLNSSHYLTETELKAGNESFLNGAGEPVTGKGGDGLVRITVIEAGGPVVRVKAEGSYKESSEIKVKVNNTWKDASALYVKVNGVWKEAQ